MKILMPSARLCWGCGQKPVMFDGDNSYPYDSNYLAEFGEYFRPALQVLWSDALRFEMLH